MLVQVLREFAVGRFFFPTSQESEGFFLFRRATYKGTCVEAVESAKEGEKVAPAKERFRVPQTKKFFSWFTSTWVLRDPSRLNSDSYET